MPQHLPELLSPVSTLETVHAAVHNGADAVYIGVPGWNARGRTPDLDPLALREIIHFCRVRGVRVFFAMNVLVFEQELQQLPSYLQDLIALEPDAFIIQDLGLARLIKQICPAQEIHASTQMTLASSEAVQCIVDMGFSRVVLARELSLPEIRHIKAQVQTEIEVFVHGALCVSYSGQCLTSESFGGRSANRGQCAQSCRLPYTLWVDGKEYDTQGRPYIFSPQDLCAIEEIPELAKIGVDSLKIEGRLKSPEYVAAVTASYRSQLDQGQVRSDLRESLDALFSRGLFTGWLHGADHQKLVDGHFSSHQGVWIGTVQEVTRKGVRIHLREQAPQCLAGDGMVFIHTPTGREVGGRLFAVNSLGATQALLQFRNDLDLSHLDSQWQVWRNDSPTLEAQVRQSYTDRRQHRKVPLQGILQGRENQPLQLILQDAQGHRVSVPSDEPLSLAQKALDNSWIHEEIAALGNTPYALEKFELHIGNTFIPKAWVRKMRQAAIQQMDALRLQWHDLPVQLPKAFPQGQIRKKTNEPLLNLVVRREEQLSALKSGFAIDSIFLDFDYGKRHEKALQIIRDLGYKAGIATLRIHKSGENRSLEKIIPLKPDRILVRSLGALQWLKEQGLGSAGILVGDHSLNLCNSMTAEWLQNQGLETLHPAWDLNRQQLLDLLRQFGGSPFEVGLHFYVPTYHMEHCVFAFMLSDGPRYPQCKVPCMMHQLEVQDHKGEKHFLQSDAECRNTLYLGKPQSMVKLVPELLQLGVQQFRLEVLHENAAQVLRKVECYSALLRGQKSAEQVYREMAVQEKYGITEGQIFNQTRWVDRKKEG